MATSWTEEDLATLRDAIKQGVRKVDYQDKSVTYHSLDEMLKLLRIMEEALGVKKKSGRLFAEAGKGLC